MLAGMAVTFAGVATLAAVGGGWAVQANQAGRWAAILLLGFFGLTLLFPRLADRAMQPLVRLGSRLSSKADQGQERIGSSLLLGIATGLLWAPCAGPILGLILTGAALERRQRRAPRCCCSPMRSARRPRWRWRCWSAARCSRR